MILNTDLKDRGNKSFLTQFYFKPNRISWTILSINLNNIVNLPFYFLLNLFDSIYIVYILTWRLVKINYPQVENVFEKFFFKM